MPATKIYVAEVDYDAENLDVEDSGCAQIYTVDNLPPESDIDVGMFIKIQSWDLSHRHVEMQKLKGKRIRVTVEIID